MYLYYTTVTENELAQLKPNLSLGGFKSSSRVVNSKFGNLFTDISNVTIANYNQNQYIGLVLKNESGAPRTNVEMWFEFPVSCYSKLRIAAVDMVVNSEGILQMEHISGVNEQPLNAEFFEANGDLAKVSIGDLAIDENVGIWIERELLLSFIKENQEKIYELDPLNNGRYLEIILKKEDDIKLGISWD